MYIVTATLFDKKNCGTELISVNRSEDMAKISAKHYAEYLSEKGKDLIIKENKTACSFIHKTAFTVFKKTTPVAVCQVLFVPEESYENF